MLGPGTTQLLLLIPWSPLSKWTHHKLLLLHGQAARWCQLRAGWFAQGTAHGVGILGDCTGRGLLLLLPLNHSISPRNEDRGNTCTPPGGRWLQGQQEENTEPQGWKGLQQLPATPGCRKQHATTALRTGHGERGQDKQNDPPASPN